jgi:MoxR-like ATPase
VAHLRESPMLRIQPSARATISLLKGSRALAVLEERDYVLPDDVKFLAPYVLQHRVFLTPEAISEEVSPGSLISEALEKVPVPKEP